ncbi:MAG: DciA family protein [Pseudomonadota bacterium]|nr:DciA family protein [Pseudomonadota bacterium]
MKRAPRPLKHVIAEDATLAAWQSRYAREQALLLAVRRYLPRQLAERIRACELDTGEVELIAPAGAVAAAVRQRTPELAVALQREGWVCCGVRVRVQVSSAAPVQPREARQTLEHGALAPIARLRGELAAGPLKAALTRLLRRTGGG